MVTYAPPEWIIIMPFTWGSSEENLEATEFSSVGHYLCSLISACYASTPQPIVVASMVPGVNQVDHDL